MIRYSIYVVDDEESIRDAALLTLTSYAVRAFASAEDALPVVDEAPPDLILMDIGLPGISGVEAMSRIRAKHPQVLFIMITAYEDAETVIAAMKQGAYDYIVKPLQMDTLRKTIANALETIRLRKEVQALQARLIQDNLPIFIGQSREVADLWEFVGQVAASPDAPVLIVGETGTGKELIASAIHYHSPNFNGPFVSLNCAAIPAELIESELFGYESGAFSGARPGGKPGLIEQAAGGTLFLDEVGDLSPEAQAKLLRFLDAGEYYRVGGTKKHATQTRVVSATNRDLAAMVEAGGFRRDLYYRLAVLKVEVPALERRREDILPIAGHFLVQFADKYQKSFTGMAAAAEAALMAHPWRGNVRELKAAIERGVLSGHGPELQPADLGLEAPPAAAMAPAGAGGPAGGLPALGPEGLDLSAVLEEVERDYLRQALELAEGSDVKAAQLLGMNYHTLRYRKKKLGIL
ncbi:MAG: sigma-54 dependent transcriptional regulator [Pseudomonadota bacterium]